MTNRSNQRPEPLLTPMPNKAKRLRDLIQSGETVMVPGAFNAIAAKIAEDIGYDAIYVSGAGVNNGVCGYPDIGMMTMTEFAQQGGYIARAVNIPAIADADTGFGEPVNIYRTVQEYERAGLSGLHIEDQVFPKRCGHLGGKEVISTEAMVQKVQAAVSARQNPDFVVIARVDSRAIHGFDDAVCRAHAYLEAGADMIFPEAMESPEEFQAFAQQVQAPLLANMTEFGKTPLLSQQDFHRFGYNMVIYPMTAFRVMMHAVREALGQLKHDGSQATFLDRMTPRTELYDLIHYDAYEALDASLVKQVPRS